jgi:hypothetical protein
MKDAVYAIGRRREGADVVDQCHSKGPVSARFDTPTGNRSDAGDSATHGSVLLIVLLLLLWYLRPKGHLTS